MDEKTLVMLEFPKILERLAGYTSFSASGELARALCPTTDLAEARMRQAQTSEARRLLSIDADVSVGGANDVRPQVDLAEHGAMLEPFDLLAIKTTLVAARTIARTLDRLQDQFPIMGGLAARLPSPPGLVDAISRSISERGDILDFASEKLANIRHDLKIAHERLMTKLERIINDPRSAPMLQEALITQRNGRYVVPLRAEFKGRLRSIIHDQSQSGATLFVEPLVAVELNNQYRELQLAERDEERRILTELSRQVGLYTPLIIELVEIMAEIDLAFARAKYAEDLHATEPVLYPFREPSEKGHPGSVIRLYEARHPLLRPESVVPIDIYMDDEIYALVITGPNTGGKTVTLKTLGLLVLMAQAGLHIPAQSGSELSIFNAVYADIGDEQSIEQSLSTFSGHVTNLVRILSQADRFSLALLDELGAGTDPQEGSALARAVLGHLLERHITSLVATHYPELKAYAHATPGVVNASVEFDLETLRPTYHLTIGLPGRSNALAIAERLGLPAEIISAARSSLHPDDLRAEDLLDEIHRQRDLARQARAFAEQAAREADATRITLGRRLEMIEDERRRILEKARTEAGDEVAGLRIEVDEVRRDLNRARQPLQSLASIENQVEAFEEQVEQPVERKPGLPGKAAIRSPLRLGEKVRLRSLRMEGVVSALGENEIEVQVGGLRVRARLADVVRAGEEVAEPAPGLAPSRQPTPPAGPGASQDEAGGVFRPSPGMELDLRGQRAEDAVDMLERYLESAYLAGLPFARIIHGKGTGRLRQVVREILHDSPHVKSWEAGNDNEGGDGVTIARLVSD
jgi:DNA mismatch repair protein MutS2